MNIILYFFRDTLSGIHYFIYAFILFFLIFSIIGYLLKQKYGKYEIKLATSQSEKKVEETPKVQPVVAPVQTTEVNSTTITNNNQNVVSENK